MKNNLKPIFGDDGFRSQFGKGLMSKKNLEYFALSMSDYIYKKNLDKHPIIIARDTRLSGKYIEKLLTKIFISNGINVVLANILPTPGLSKLIELNRYACGIMITASHNPAPDNGIKLFSKTGYKMPLKDERSIEIGIRKRSYTKRKSLPGRVIFKDKSDYKYYSHIVRDKEVLQIKNKIVIDCSNGAMSNIIKDLFSEHKNFEIINCKPNGKNINHKCGALEADNLLKYIKKNKLDFGVAFDGDGDRSVFVSRVYGVIETEKLFYLFCTILFKNLNSKSVVVSEVFNYGIIQLLREKFKKVWITKAGDRNVTEKLKLENLFLGAEPSGHFNYPKKSKSMDGLVALVLFINLLKKRNLKINDDIKKYKKMFKRIKIDISIKKKLDVKVMKALNKICLNDEERLLVRESMWEPVLRVHYDYKLKNNFYLYKKKFANL